MKPKQALKQMSMMLLLFFSQIYIFGEEPKSSNGYDNICKIDFETFIIDPVHNTRNSIDWAGIYIGTVSNLTDDIINVQIELNWDETYAIQYYYEHYPDEIFTSSSVFEWDDLGRTITLSSDVIFRYFQVGENILILLDIDGERVLSDSSEMIFLLKNEY